MRYSAVKVGQVGGAAYRPNRPQKKVQATIRLLSLRLTFVSSEDAFVCFFKLPLCACALWDYCSKYVTPLLRKRS